MAEKYVTWAKTAVAAGRWTEALAGLERGADFSSVSSDLDYLLGVVRFHENRPVGMVLEALNRGLETNRWDTYTPTDAKLLRAEVLIRIRRYSEALADLAPLPQSIDTVCLKLSALKGLNDRTGFIDGVTKAMDAYPRDPRPVRIFFTYMTDRLPLGNEGDIMSLSLKRLPLLLSADRELACLAAPFIPDADEARRVIGAYRAIPAWTPDSIPIALNLGLIDGKDGIDELFGVSSELNLDRNLLLAVWNLLRDDDQRERFQEKLSHFSGIITEDADKDGYPEVQVRYTDGIIGGYAYDADQDGLPELVVSFEAGVPVKMEQVFQAGSGDKGLAYPPARDAERTKAALYWEQYPAVLKTDVEETAYIPKPFDFFFFPLYFTKLESGGLLYPERNPLTPELSRQSLLFSSLYIERPSREFTGGVEQIQLNQGIPQRAWETLQGRLVSETFFRLGRPVTQRIDLDGNGYLETARYFIQPKKNSPAPDIWAERIIEFSESDWNEDGIFEYGEQYSYNEDSYTTVRFWDLDRDGVREFSDQLRYVKIKK
jgi:hypothetical protein